MQRKFRQPQFKLRSRTEYESEVEVLEGENTPVFETAIFKYSFVEQLPLGGILAKDSKDRNARRVWDQYMAVGKEITDGTV